MNMLDKDTVLGILEIVSNTANDEFLDEVRNALWNNTEGGGIALATKRFRVGSASGTIHMSFEYDWEEED